MARSTLTLWTALAVLAGPLVLRPGFADPPPAPPEAQARAIPVGDLVRALDDPAERWRALRRLASRGEDALPAVPRILVLLGDEDELTRRLAAEALGSVGPAAASAAEEPLRAAHARDRDEVFRFMVERALARIGGWSRFTHDMPEEVTFVGRPFLRVVEEAARREWLRGEDAAVADRCWRKTLEHVRRLQTDRLYRLGEETHARLASGERVVFESVWAPPFLVCASDGSLRPAETPSEEASAAERKRPLAEVEAEARKHGVLLKSGAEVAQAVYRHVQRRHGKALDLRPLEAEYGGRPDLGPAVRSFVDGFPIVLWIWSSPEAFERAKILFRWRFSRSEDILCLLPDDGIVHVVAGADPAVEGGLDVERTGFAACAGLLRSWRMQANNWRNADVLMDPITVGLCAEEAGWRRDETGKLGFTGAPKLFRRSLRVHVESARERGLPEPAWIPFRRAAGGPTRRRAEGRRTAGVGRAG
jgi:hypothetical protein